MVNAIVQIEIHWWIVIENDNFLPLKNQTTIGRSVTPFADVDDGIAQNVRKN